jgi:2-hydroxy-3-keto-5-methylthiopentenyl-1-phosphate phosphatase
LSLDGDSITTDFSREITTDGSDFVDVKLSPSRKDFYWMLAVTSPVGVVIYSAGVRYFISALIGFEQIFYSVWSDKKKL